MKTIKFSSLVIFLAILVFAVFLGGREINSRIEEAINTNYRAEIDSLKEKIDKQSQLLNSIINVGNKSEENEDTNGENTDGSTDVGASEVKAEFEYVKENGGITITRYNGNQSTVQIPNNIEQLPVLKIGENAFAETKIKSITLPSSCTEIDWFAFYGCYALTTVYLSSSVSTIGYGAFDSCNKALTIYCEKDSYAQKYAQSFGISYSYFQ